MATPSSNSSVSVGPWPKGFQNIYSPTQTPPGALVWAKNVYIEADGTVVPAVSARADKRTLLNDSPLKYDSSNILDIDQSNAVQDLGGDGYKDDNDDRPYRSLFSIGKAGMVSGTYSRYWRSRLLVARGQTLYVSDPFAYGVYDTRAGVIPMPGRIDFLEPVEGGVFVAIRNQGVYFLAGTSPEDWQLKHADIILAQPNTSLLIPTAQMKLDIQNRPEWVAVWLTSKGFAVGLPDGSILYPQADLLSGLPLGSTGSITFNGDRLIALTQ